MDVESPASPLGQKYHCITLFDCIIVGYTGLVPVCLVCEPGNFEFSHVGFGMYSNIVVG